MNKAVTILLAVTAVGAAVWLIAKKKKPGLMSKAASGKSFKGDKNLDALIDSGNKSAPAPMSRPPPPTYAAAASPSGINWARYDDYVNRYQAFYSSLTFAQQAMMPPPLPNPLQARATYATQAEATDQVNGHSQRVQAAWPSAQALVQTATAAITTAPTVLPTDQNMALINQQAATALASWYNSIPQFTRDQTRAPPLFSYVSFAQPTLYTQIRAQYQQMAAWQAQASATSTFYIPPPPQLPLGYPG